MIRGSLFALLLGVAGWSIGLAEEPAKSSEPVRITDVKVRLSDHGPVVLLGAEGRRFRYSSI